MTLPFLTPTPPDYAIDWDALDREHAFVRALRDCPQDPLWHAEGDVWIHTRMVCESLVSLAAWRALAERERAITFAAALLHDVAKPACTRSEDGRIISPGHSARGEIMARRLLWECDADPGAREEVARIITVHQVPFFALDKPSPARIVHRLSQSVRADLVALVAEADARGRRARDQQRLLDNIELFRELAREEACFEAPRRFPSDLARVRYFRSEAQSPDYDPYDDTWGEVVLMSGLPAAGKDTWLKTHATHLPVASLDDLRHELDVEPGEPQGEVVSAARGRARDYLRRHQPFAWNATNLSRTQRAPLLDLFMRYGARVRIVHVEASCGAQAQRNGSRATPVPRHVIDRMLDRWQVPDPTEAHVVALTCLPG
jgi:predicted kinase